MELVNDIFDLLGEKLATVATSDVVAGTPLQIGEVTIVPLSRIGIGFASGGGSGEGEVPDRTGRPGAHQGKGSGSGGGGGAKIRPVAVAVFSSEGVQILQVPDKKGRIEKLLDHIPGLIERVKKAG